MTVIADVASEEAVLGCIAELGGNTMLPLLHQTGLRPEHFSRHEGLFRRVLEVHDDGDPVDTVTVPHLAPFILATPSFGSWETYAKKVIDKARWRSCYRAGQVLMEGAEVEDERALAEAERLLLRPAEHDRVFTRDRLQDLMMDRLEREIVAGWLVPLLNQRLQRGTVTLWGAWTSHGKTVWVDQQARSFHEQAAKVWMWINEMSADERMCRFAAAETGLDLEDIQENRLSDEDKAKVVRALKKVPFEIVECPGWSAEEIARDIRIRQPDIAIIDILHRIPYETERDLSRVSRILGDAAKLANCAIIATVHLNRSRIMTADRPQPTLADIKGASAFEQDADAVGMVWRQDDPVSGRPQNNGMLYYLKVRMGKPHGVEVTLDGSRATFRKDSWDEL